jgi:hypothetical protein
MLTLTPSNRQDSTEAIKIAARGKVKVVFKQQRLADLKECVLSFLLRCWSKTLIRTPQDI